MKTLSMLLVVVGMLFAAAGCNTMRGVGQDVEKVGDTVKDATN